MYIFLLLVFLSGNSAVSCPANSHYESCASNSQLTCTNTIYDPNDKTNCVGACVCDEGFIKDEKKNLCVLPHQCPGMKRCGKNEEFNFCVQCAGYANYISCVTYGNPASFLWCPPWCSAKCVCKENHIFDELTKRCVLPMQCSCTKGRVFLLCPNPYVNDRNCGCRCRDPDLVFSFELTRCVRNTSTQAEFLRL